MGKDVWNCGLLIVCNQVINIEFHSFLFANMGVEIICDYLGVNINIIYVEINVILEIENDALLQVTPN